MLMWETFFKTLLNVWFEQWFELVQYTTEYLMWVVLISHSQLSITYWKKYKLFHYTRDSQIWAVCITNSQLSITSQENFLHYRVSDSSSLHVEFLVEYHLMKKIWTFSIHQNVSYFSILHYQFSREYHHLEEIRTPLIYFWFPNLSTGSLPVQFSVRYLLMKEIGIFLYTGEYLIWAVFFANSHVGMTF